MAALTETGAVMAVSRSMLGLQNLHQGFTMDLDADHRHLTLHLQGTLDATAVDRLIERLAQLRAQMQPPVPLRWAPMQDIDVTNDPALKVGPTGDATILLAIRHDGFGWCCFDFPAATAAELRDMLARHTVGVPSRLAKRADDGPGH